MNETSKGLGRRLLLPAIILYCMVLCLYALIPQGTLGGSVTDWLPGHYRTAHALAYAGLTGLLLVTLSAYGASLPLALLAAVMVSAAVGAALELAQWLVPWRGAGWPDFASDLAGTGLACILWLTWRAAAAILRPR